MGKQQNSEIGRNKCPIHWYGKKMPGNDRTDRKTSAYEKSSTNTNAPNTTWLFGGMVYMQEHQQTLVFRTVTWLFGALVYPVVPLQKHQTPNTSITRTFTLHDKNSKITAQNPKKLHQIEKNFITHKKSMN